MDQRLLESINVQLPSYLFPEDKNELLSELKKFPDFNYFLSSYFEPNKQLQGDCWEGFYYVEASKNIKGVIISNSCDIDEENTSDGMKNILFSPLLSLNKYLDLLKNNERDESYVNDLAKSIKTQGVTRLFYMPSGDYSSEEHIILLDHVYPMRLGDFLNTEREKIFTLSQTGFYMFLLKLSIHFTRFQEGISRRE